MGISQISQVSILNKETHKNTKTQPLEMREKLGIRRQIPYNVLREMSK